MLLDMLGVLLGFSVVMLLLSLVVTALVQATQSTIRLRARNLRWGVSEFLQREALAPPDAAKSAASEILKAAAPGARSPLACRELGKREFIDILDGARRLDAAKTAGKVASLPTVSLRKRFEELEVATGDRFRRWVRVITIGWAVIVGAYYQISAPDLLARLSEAPELREQYAAAAGAAAVEAETAMQAAPVPEEISRKALNELADEHPDVTKALDERDPELVLAELELAFEGSSEHQAALLTEYAAIEDRLYREEIDAALLRAQSASVQLSALGIQAWPHGWSYYTQPRNLVGVLMTVVLLTLGAPFWYQQITTLARLRGIFAPPKAKTDT